MVHYKIEGMTCGHCKFTVEKVFSENGKKATANVEEGIVTVDQILNEEELQILRLRLDEDGYSLGNVK